MADMVKLLGDVGTFLVAIGALVVLFKISRLVTVLTERIKDWKG
jgi:hypothetical protein